MKKNRTDWEKKVLRKMFWVYCKGQEHDKPLCRDCRALLDYALQRLETCKFGNDKMFCSKCPVHCYKPAMRDAIKKVMRYSGPRMLYHDPLMALRHLLQK